MGDLTPEDWGLKRKLGGRRGPWLLPSLIATAALAASCAIVPPSSDLRSQRIEQAVLPMARAALDAGQVETARRLYNRLLDVDGGSVAAHMGLGDVALAEGAPGHAAVAYGAAVALAGSGGERHAALLAHGRAALAAGQPDAARESFARLAAPREQASGADVAWALNGLAALRLLDGDQVEAAALIERAVEVDPQEPRFRANLGLLRGLQAVPPEDGEPSAVTAPTVAEP